MKLNYLFEMMRKGKDMTQEEIADIIGVARATIAQFEGGNLSALSRDSLTKIAPTLHINPDFITGESLNPFRCDDLIKLYLKGSILTQVNLEPLYSLLSSNFTKVFFLHPPLKLLHRINHFLTDEAVYAIIIKDIFGNTFLFRHKKNNVFIFPDKKSFRSRLTNRSLYKELHIYFFLLKIDKYLYQKIKNWTVKKEDIEYLFKQFTVYPLSEEEENLILKIRERKISPETIFNYIVKKQKN